MGLHVSQYKSDKEGKSFAVHERFALPGHGVSTKYLSINRQIHEDVSGSEVNKG